MTTPSRSKQEMIAATTDIVMEEAVRTSSRNSIDTIDTSPVTASIDRNKGKEMLYQKLTYVFPLASNEKPSSLRNLHTHQWRNAFSRKPRSLVFHQLPDTRSKDSMDLIVAR
jgi:hypothetical protein